MKDLGVCTVSAATLCACLSFSCLYPAFQQARTASHAWCHLRRRQHAAQRHVTCHIYIHMQHLRQHLGAVCSGARCDLSVPIEAHARTCGVRRAEKNAREVLSQVLHIDVYMHVYAYTL
jgi:hypothetical protein